MDQNSSKSNNISIWQSHLGYIDHFGLVRIGLLRTVLVACLFMMTSGCVQRRMIVRTQPEGAFVTIDRQPIGYSPVSVPFTYYGTRDIQIEKDGFKTVKVQQDVDAPWYGKFPVSFLTENFSPREIRDQRILDFQLEPRTQANENMLLERASTLRSNVQRGTVTAPVQ